MKKRVAAILLIMLMLVMVACGKKQAEDQPTTGEVTIETAIPETTEKEIPGVEDSFFDIEPEETTEATEATEETESQDQDSDSSVETTEASQPNDPDPTEPKPTEPKATEPSEPAETTQPTETVSSDSNLTEYEKFQNMSPSEQQAYVESFSSIEAFFTWYNAAKEEYEEANPPIEVGSGIIDIGAIIEGKN